MRPMNDEILQLDRDVYHLNYLKCLYFANFLIDLYYNLVESTDLNQEFDVDFVLRHYLLIDYYYYLMNVGPFDVDNIVAADFVDFVECILKRSTLVNRLPKIDLMYFLFASVRKCYLQQNNSNVDKNQNKNI